jgi:hypothetical protein
MSRRASLLEPTEGGSPLPGRRLAPPKGSDTIKNAVKERYMISLKCGKGGATKRLIGCEVRGSGSCLGADSDRLATQGSDTFKNAVKSTRLRHARATPPQDHARFAATQECLCTLCHSTADRFFFSPCRLDQAAADCRFDQLRTCRIREVCSITASPWPSPVDYQTSTSRHFQPFHIPLFRTFPVHSAWNAP